MSDFDNIIDNVFPEPDDPIAEAVDASLNAGESANEDALLLPSPSNPMQVAKRFISDQYTDRVGKVLLRHSRNTFYRYSGTHWPEAEDRTLRAELYDFTEDEAYRTDKGEVKDWAPTVRKINDLLDALKARGHLPADVNPPSWLSGDEPIDPENIIPVANGLLNISTGHLLDHTPGFWSHNCLPYQYDPDAPAPSRWYAFLRELWEDDQQSIDTLQELFGYFLTQDTTQQKIPMLVGPKRSGKGTIARVATGLLGPHNVAAPTLAGLATNFGISPLIDRPLAIISDARLSTKSDTQIVVERLLSISGEDSITIDRKYRDPWTGRLPTRFLILTNELPRLSDSSGALASRFIVLQTTASFYGKEDPTLTDILLGEATGILNWALEGLYRLRDRGHFQQPDSSAEAIRQLEDLASPVSAFVTDWCDIGPEYEVKVDNLYQAWRSWCDHQGMSRIPTKETFGRDLRAAVPQVKKTRPREGEERIHIYVGIRLKPQSPVTLTNGDQEPVTAGHPDQALKSLHAELEAEEIAP